jgi:hypothetical protein
MPFQTRFLDRFCFFTSTWFLDSARVFMTDRFCRYAEFFSNARLFRGWQQTSVRAAFLLIGLGMCLGIPVTAAETRAPRGAAAETGLPPGALVFSGAQKGTWDIFAWIPAASGTGAGVKAQPASGSLVNLTRSLAAEGNPVYWPAKRSLVFSRRGEDGRFSLVLLNLVTRQETLFTDKRGSLGWPQPSPWADELLAVLEDPQSGWTTPGLIRLTNGTFEPFPDDPLPGGQMAWISSQTILVTRVRGNEFELRTHDLTDHVEAVLIADGRNWLSAANPQGGAPFFFTRRLGNQGSIFQLHPPADPDGAYTCEDFSRAPQYDWQPAVAPGGIGITYLSLRQGRFRVVYKSLNAPFPETEISLPAVESVYHPSWVSDPFFLRLLRASRP